MIGYEMVNFHEIDSYCKNEGLNTEHFLHQKDVILKKIRKNKVRRIIRIVVSLLR